MAEQKSKNKRRRGLPIPIVLIVLLGTNVAIVAALTIYALTVQKINLFGGQYQDTQFSITSWDTKIKGKNKVTVDVTVKNTDSSAHVADVTVQLLDSSGNIINIGGDMESTQSTGSLAGGASVTLTFTFMGTGLVSQYDSPLVIVKQTS